MPAIPEYVRRVLRALPRSGAGVTVDFLSSWTDLSHADVARSLISLRLAGEVYRTPRREPTPGGQGWFWHRRLS
jgi:hypothetical protein